MLSRTRIEERRERATERVRERKDDIEGERNSTYSKSTYTESTDKESTDREKDIYRIFTALSSQRGCE